LLSKLAHEAFESLQMVSLFLSFLRRQPGQ